MECRSHTSDCELAISVRNVSKGHGVNLNEDRQKAGGQGVTPPCQGAVLWLHIFVGESSVRLSTPRRRKEPFNFSAIPPLSCSIRALNHEA